MAVSGLQPVASPWLRLRFRAEPWRRVRLALIVWYRAAQLDRQLAAGTSPQASTLIRLRAQRITGHRSRRRLADGLARALDSARDITPGFTAAVRPHRREVLAARIVLATLDRRLRAPEPVTAHGVAMLQVLLTEGTSPLYRPSEPGALGSRLRAAAAALEPTHRYV
jgi:hypothetical protein